MIKMLNEHELEQIVGGIFEVMTLGDALAFIRLDPSTPDKLREDAYSVAMHLGTLLDQYCCLYATPDGKSHYLDVTDREHPCKIESIYDPWKVAERCVDRWAAGVLTSPSDWRKIFE